MKKLFLLSVIAVFAIGSVNAQGANVGASVGLITGDFSDGYSFNITLDGNYLWEVSDDIEAGVATGYSYSILKSEFDGDAAQFVPLAAAGRFNISDEFSAGVDLGYAVGINEGNDGGFYYAPRVQYSVSESLDIVAAYRGVSVDAGPITLGFNTITFGVEIGI